MSSTKSVVRNGGPMAQAPVLLDLARALWRCLRPRSHARTRRLATLSDHLLADIGLDRPVHGHPARERFIHRR